MNPSGLVYIALGATTVLSVGATWNQIQPAVSRLVLSETGIVFPDGTVQTTAAPSDSRRGFYLTDFNVDGANALGACGPAYHMASLWEILDVSNLRYAKEDPYALKWGFDGPVPAGYLGWVRTGTWSDHSTTPGVANCSHWSQATTGFGTVAHLANHWPVWAGDDCGGWIAPWRTQTWDCWNIIRTWCVQD